MTNNSTFIGMDVHKNSIDIAIAEQGRKGQVRHYGKIDGTLAALDKVFTQKWQICPISALREKSNPRNINHMHPKGASFGRLWLYFSGALISTQFACFWMNTNQSSVIEGDLAANCSSVS